jgi:hypothetical protein
MLISSAVHLGLGMTVALLDWFFSGPKSIKKMVWIVGHSHRRKFTAALVVELLTLVGVWLSGAPNFATALVFLIPLSLVFVIGIDLAELGMKFVFGSLNKHKTKKSRVTVLPADAEHPELNAKAMQTDDGVLSELKEPKKESVSKATTELDRRLNNY